MTLRLRWASLWVTAIALWPVAAEEARDEASTAAAPASVVDVGETALADEPASDGAVEDGAVEGGTVEDRRDARGDDAGFQTAVPSQRSGVDAAAVDGEPTERKPTETPVAAEVFVPTEDISEDFAVPFPVDI